MRILVVNDEYLVVEMIILSIATYNAPSAEIWAVLGMNDHQMECGLNKPGENLSYTMVGWNNLDNFNRFDLIIMDWRLKGWRNRSTQVNGEYLVQQLVRGGFRGVILANSSDPWCNKKLIEAGATCVAAPYGRPLSEQITQLLTRQPV